MTIHILVVFLVMYLSIPLLIVHSRRLRGRRLTVSFFVSSFLFGLAKETGSFISIPGVFSHPAPFIHTSGMPLSLAIVNTAIGWMIVFYLSWHLAERIFDRIRKSSPEIFPLILVAAMIVAAFAYGIEEAAVGCHWWRWHFFDPLGSGYLTEHVHPFALSAWFYFSISFFTPYFLIECSRFKKTGWKYLFFLLPFTRVYTMLFIGRDIPREMYDYGFLGILIILSFLYRLGVESSRYTESMSERRGFGWCVFSAPLLVTAGIILMSVLSQASCFDALDSIVSVFPLSAVLLLSLSFVPLWVITTAWVVTLAMFGVTGISAGVPIVVVLFLRKISCKK
ncbi:MAG: hypothetical protein JXD21_00550 [Candidatus Omnitrophica bacterium]|nr:hypothetical protein [Candidatus Omnitrophota bacterium]